MNIVKHPPLIQTFGPKMWFGADPELFLFDCERRKIVPSEELIPENGIIVADAGSIVRDGVQVELHPNPTNCRQLMANEIGKLLKKLISTTTNIYPTQRTTVDIPAATLKKLSASSRQLGCQSSKNHYDPTATVNVDGETYLTRSAGGHVHISIQQTFEAIEREKAKRFNRERLIPLLDIIAGNTSVLFDSDPRAAERRQNYGRAGEFREPVYGIEYRTLSNFWLRDYATLSLALGLVKTAVGIEAMTSVFDNGDYSSILLDMVDLSKIVEAINTANRKLAFENLRSIVPFVKRYLAPGLGPLDTYSIDAFVDYAASLAERPPIVGETYFSSWVAGRNYIDTPGWEALFLSSILPSASVTALNLEKRLGEGA